MSESERVGVGREGGEWRGEGGSREGGREVSGGERVGVGREGGE